MPYIPQKQRPEVDRLVAPVVSYLKKLPENEQDGVLNYIVFKILRQLYPLRYFHINRALGVLSAIANEFYRRVAAPYEDIKIKERGDVT